jgi:acetoin utilization protein AcuC
MNAYGELASRMHSIAHELCGGRYIVFGGGGYKPESVARAWTIMFSRISEVTLPDKIPSGWVDLCRKAIGGEPPNEFSDKYERRINNVERERIAEMIEERIREIKTKIMPIQGINT